MHLARKTGRRECEWKRGDGALGRDDATEHRGRHVGLDRMCLLMEVGLPRTLLRYRREIAA